MSSISNNHCTYSVIKHKCICEKYIRRFITKTSITVGIIR
ncbi:hypothetical protein BSSC8_24110 [Bacillus subtilis subsp. subtilis str. SC-8]|nr:hypothetical protein BSSC8_24110 [Bacillus subtilis subsp. subtilis str. SC-8]